MTPAHFPQTIYLVHHLPTNSYGSAYVEETRALACFVRPASARRFAQQMETHNNLIVEVSLADACEIAAQVGLTALALADTSQAAALYHFPRRKSRF